MSRATTYILLGIITLLLAACTTTTIQQPVTQDERAANAEFLAANPDYTPPGSNLAGEAKGGIPGAPGGEDPTDPGEPTDPGSDIPDIAWTSCSDSDEGITPDVAGELVAEAARNKNKVTTFARIDTCNEGMLEEWYCNGLNPAITQLPCEIGCEAGACIQGATNCVSNGCEAGYQCNQDTGICEQSCYDDWDCPNNQMCRFYETCVDSLRNPGHYFLLRSSDHQQVDLFEFTGWDFEAANFLKWDGTALSFVFDEQEYFHFLQYGETFLGMRMPVAANSIIMEGSLKVSEPIFEGNYFGLRLGMEDYAHFQFTNYDTAQQLISAKNIDTSDTLSSSVDSRNYFTITHAGMNYEGYRNPYTGALHINGAFPEQPPSNKSVTFQLYEDSDVITDTLREGETNEYVVSGTTYEVTILVIGRDTTGAQSVKFLINGEVSDALQIDESELMASGVMVKVLQFITTGTEICGNAIDDDGDGLVDEDCGPLQVKFLVNGEVTDALEKGDVDTLSDGTQIAVREIIETTQYRETDPGSIVEFYIGANKIIFEDTDGAAATGGSVEVNNENIEDANVIIDYETTYGGDFRINSITYSLEADTTGTPNAYLLPGDRLSEQLEEPEGLFADNMDVLYAYGDTVHWGVTNPAILQVLVQSTIASTYPELLAGDASWLQSYRAQTQKGETTANQYLRPGAGTGEHNVNASWTEYLVFYEGMKVFEYELEFVSGLLSDIEGTVLDDYLDETLYILGDYYSILDATTDSYSVTLTLMKGDIQDVLAIGETKTYTIDGKDYEVTVLVIGRSGGGTLVEICNDGIDNDGDGLVDEGCEEFCVSSDSGADVTVQGTSQDAELFYSDICTGDYITEYFCHEGVVKSFRYLCGAGCDSGACNPQTEWIKTHPTGYGDPSELPFMMERTVRACLDDTEVYKERIYFDEGYTNYQCTNRKSTQCYDGTFDTYYDEKCYYSCTSDSQCPEENQICSGGECLTVMPPPCNTDFDCGSGFMCVNSVCVALPTNYVIGDVDEDGKVTTIDAQQIARYADHLSTTYTIYPANSDITLDGIVDSYDADMVAGCAAGLYTCDTPQNEYWDARIARGLLLMGDVNADGVLNVIDAQQVLAAVEGQPTPNFVYRGNADVTHDFMVDHYDAEKIAGCSIGLYDCDEHLQEGYLNYSLYVSDTLIGDVDNDGVMEAVDAQEIQTHVDGGNTPHYVYPVNADVNFNGIVDSDDAQMVLACSIGGGNCTWAKGYYYLLVG